MRAAVSLALGSQSHPLKKTERSLHAHRGRRKTRRDILKIERLEDRLLFTVSPAGAEQWGLLSSHGNVCSCPICTGIGLEQIPAEEFQPTGSAQAPLSSLPQLHSNAGATAKLFLDFDGRVTSTWGFYTNVNTPVFSQDADLTTFSDTELASIYEIWTRVAEDYAPFNIDVTTVDPGSMADGVVAVVAIGGSYSDWYGSSAGGVAFVGAFYNGSPNVGFVFENNLGSNSKNIAEAASHEAGHMFGLQHQAKWSGSTLVESYHSGNGSWAPIMGVGYSVPRTTWHNGATSAGPTAYQDDLAILSGANNGFGYKADDFGGTVGTAGNLPVTGTSVNFSGLIGQSDDVDVWSFTTTGGTVTLQLTGAQYGSNLDAVLELWDSVGATVVSNSPSGSQGASFTTSVGAGTYYVVARGLGDYGDMGQYTITGSLPAASAVPEVHLSVAGVGLMDGGTLDFGTTTVGSAVTRTITVTNQGSAALTLTSLNSGSFPAGFSLISNLGATTLNPGESTTFVVRLDAANAGSFSGSIQLANSDGDENPYDLTFTGTVTAPEIAIDISGSGVADGQTVNFGSTTLGQSVTRVFTVTNTGSATLTLTPLNAGSMPAGFTLVTNVGSTSLAAGQSTTFSIRLDAASAGSFSGAIQLLNNDGDENPYDLALTGSVSAPEIELTLGGSNVSSGQTVDFGATTVGQLVSRTFTITNSGNSTLTLTPINTLSWPAGFSLTSNLGSTSLAAGQSTTFCVQLSAANVGSFSGGLQVLSNDADESPFALTLSGNVQAPEIEISLGGDDVTTGQVIDYGLTTVGTSLDRTFTITNSGTSVLTLTALDPGSLPAGFSLVSNISVTSLAPGQSTSFTIRFDALAAGSFGGSISLINSDSDESPFALTIQGVAATPVPADVTVLVAGQEVQQGGVISFGTSVTGYTLERRIWIRNDGGVPLTLAPLDPFGLPTGFSLLEDLADTSLAPGESTSFILRLDAQSAGNYGGQIVIASNDDDGPFTFEVTATVVDPIPPLVQVIDNGDAGSTQAGAWKRITGKGNAQDIHTANKGQGAAVYAWSFGNLPQGQYRVWATWTNASTNASNAKYSLLDGGSALSTTVVNQRLAPSGLNVNGTRWKLLGTATVQSGQLVVKLNNAANGQVVADAIRIERVITVFPPTPEISVSVDNCDVASGGGAVDFGSPDLGNPCTRTFTVTNYGTASLTLAAIDPNSLPTGFSLVQNLSSTFLTSGESATFSVRLNADTAGTLSGPISILSNDVDESQFSLNVCATVYDPNAAVTRIIDDGSPGNTRGGAWTRLTNKGYAGDQWTAVKGSGSIHSTWTFANLPNGEYRIQASWKADATYATNTPFTLLNGGQFVSTVRVNQRVAPGDVWDGGWWKSLGTVTVTGHQLVVKLNNSANGKIVADAIRIEKIAATGQIPATDLLTMLFASQLHAAPDGLPLPVDTNHHQLPLASDQQRSEALRLAVSCDGIEVEDELLASVLDLLALTQHAQAGTTPASLDSSHDLALGSMLGPLI